MNKIGEFFSKWAFCIVLCLVAVVLLFSLGCCVYTAITNPFVGSIGCVGTLIAIAFVAGLIVVEVGGVTYSTNNKDSLKRSE